MERTPADQNLREALARLAAEDLDQVIDEARAEARECVRPILAEALADAMLEEARGREYARAPKYARAPMPAAAPEPPAAPKPLAEPEVDTEPLPHDLHRAPEPEVDTERIDQNLRQPRPPADQTTGLYVFCVLAAEATLPDELEGLKLGTTTRLVRHNNLAAVVSDVPLKEFDGEQLRENLNDMQWLEHTARAHERVLETVGEDNTLVPMRLCSIYRAEEGIEEMLTREAPTLEEALTRLKGKAEWGVKVFANAEPTPAKASAQTANGGSGADYMRQRQTERHVRQSAAQRQHDACVSIHDRLAALATEALTAPPQRAAATGRSEEMVLNGVYLVDNEDRDEFLSLVNSLQEKHEADGLELEPTGPWPAYNFVPSETGAAA